jgi:hypothetical protein
VKKIALAMATAAAALSLAACGSNAAQNVTPSASAAASTELKAAEGVAAGCYTHRAQEPVKICMKNAVPPANVHNAESCAVTVVLKHHTRKTIENGLADCLVKWGQVATSSPSAS